MKNYSIEIKWTFRFILLILAWAIGEKLVGLHDTHIDKYGLYSNLFAIPAILFYVLALNEKKKYVFNGNMTWKQGFVCGVTLSSFIALLNPFAQYMIYSSITPHFFETIIEYKTKCGHPITLKMAQDYFNMKSYIIQNSFNGLSYGTITGALASWFVRTKK